jgi:hypothetical protein
MSGKCGGSLAMLYNTSFARDVKCANGFRMENWGELCR